MDDCPVSQGAEKVAEIPSRKRKNPDVSASPCSKANAVGDAAVPAVVAPENQPQELIESAESLQILQNKYDDVNRLLIEGVSPREIGRRIFDLDFDNNMNSEEDLNSIIQQLEISVPPRARLSDYTTLDDAVELIRRSKKIMVLTGAGVSVSCGIPDFRSKDGIYASLKKNFPDLPDPTAMFCIKYFHQNPNPFFSFAKNLFPGQFEPSFTHKFIRQLEVAGKLLRNYTQNIDTLEKQVGINNVVECHGSFAKATCLTCGKKFDGMSIRSDIFQERIPICNSCGSGIIKPDIVFFGEDLSAEFHEAIARDKEDCDLLIIMGSSLKVRPVSVIPITVPPSIPQILINREKLPTYSADIELLGPCDDILMEICSRLGGSFRIFQRKENPFYIQKKFFDLETFQEAISSVNKSTADIQSSVEGADIIELASAIPVNYFAMVDPHTTIFTGADVMYSTQTSSIVFRVADVEEKNNEDEHYGLSQSSSEKNAESDGDYEDVASEPGASDDS